MNIDFTKKEYSASQEISLLICAIGFEERSSYLIKEFSDSSSINNSNTLCFYFIDNRNETSDQNYNEVLEKGIIPKDINKDNVDELLTEIENKISEISSRSESLKIHVDYSSMPRAWYANLFVKITNKMRVSDSLTFWYSHGDYSEDEKHCTTAGADDFVIFSGKASIRPRNRSHILGLGYDKTKSDAIKTVVDPSTLIVCYTYPENNDKILETIHGVHEQMLSSAAMSISLPIENFNFIVKRINEVVLDQLDKGDVILIPDGPKPLILACSIIPELLNKIGVVCFHIKSHNANFRPVNIRPTGNVSGFVINRKANE
ncbi:hypothetical protein DMA11_06830 [Marinilabiliaceae bacterium JC017]|nr:hypothetical protein DMA11_06830 [Marinilabiliaceae bacterium JC017]